MNRTKFSRTLVLILLACFTHSARSETDNASTLPPKVGDPIAITASVTADVQPVTTPPSIETSKPSNLPKLADICNTSLITSLEGEDMDDAVPVKCVCTTASVYCSDLGITQLQQLISFPKEVQGASFRGNRIANINRETFYSGKGLLELDLSHNRIDFVSSGAFSALKSLRRLDLSHNKVWSLPSHTFKDLGSLRVLKLAHNDIINVDSSLFSPLSELRELELEYNPLEELQPKHFEHLQKLERLDLRATLLTYLPDHIFVFTPALKILNLADNRLTEVPTVSLHVLDRVKTLDLRNNPIDVVPAEAFRGLSGVVRLYLDNMPELIRIEDYAFGDMTHLEELHCSYNPKLAEIGENAFVRKVDNSKVPLQQLFLRQSQLSTVPRNLLDWNDKVELHLRDNPLYCDCKADWMVNIKLKNAFQNHIRCSGPGDLENLLLSEAKGHALTCGLHLSEIVMIVCSVVATFLILVMIVAFLVWRRGYSGYTKPRYRPNKGRFDNDVTYTGDEDI